MYGMPLWRHVMSEQAVPPAWEGSARKIPKQQKGDWSAVGSEWMRKHWFQGTKIQETLIDKNISSLTK